MMIDRPSQMPRVRQELLATLGRMSEIIQGHTPERVLHIYRRMAERLPHADLYLVTRDMVRVAVDGATDVPSTALSQVWPAPLGIMALEGGTPPVTNTFGGESTGNLLVWVRDGPDVYLTLWASDTAMGQMNARMWSRAERWVPILQVEVPADIPEDLAEEAVPVRQIVSLALSAWIMMGTPTVATVSGQQVAGAKIAGQRRRELPRQVKVVELRRLASRPTEPGEVDENGREYRHRWVVRGHWRQQAWGPEHALRRTQWVPSYIKGPEDAPFLPSETVFVWRR